MSKAAKQSIVILIVLLIGVFAFASLTYLQKQQLAQSKFSLDKQIGDLQIKEKQQLTKYLQLEEKLKGVESAKAELEKKLGSIDGDIKNFDQTMKNLTDERDQWKQRVDELKAERDKILAKLEEKEKEGPKIVYKYIEKEAPAEGAAGEKQKTAAAGTVVTEDVYWAQVLKEKAMLELELEKLKSNITNSSVEVVELKKTNTDLELELNQVLSDKESIERELKDANDLADNLALELARIKNDKKFLNDRTAKLNEDNVNLRDQIKRLSSTKIALEKTIIRIQEEKSEVEKKLLETENVVQGRIDEIWQIKDSLTRELNTSKSPSNSQEVELTPIVVSSGEPGSPAESTKGKDEKPALPSKGFNGSVVSVNEENNFVIVDLGEDAGVKLGEKLNVYRGSDYVGGLQIIQTRKDISAADIKEQVAKIQVGDNVK